MTTVLAGYGVVFVNTADHSDIVDDYALHGDLGDLGFTPFEGHTEWVHWDVEAEVTFAIYMARELRRRGHNVSVAINDGYLSSNRFGTTFDGGEGQ